MGHTGRSAHRARVAITLLVAGLAACGGGGGGGSSTNAPPPAPAPTTSGLVPVAPALGVVLEADATTLRVLRPGASWVYSGQDYPAGPNSAAQDYTNTVSHAAAANGVTETSSDSLHLGADSVNVQAAGGIVKTPQQLQPVPGLPPDDIDAIELRSPVRAGDQYTAYDRHFADAGVDVDGDHVNDALDIAVWTQVVGSEVIDLPQRRAVQAIRVDTTLAQRVRFSTTGAYSATELVVQKAWYAKGIGVVQIELDQPHESVAGVRHITRERLDSWDGLTEGLGALPQQLALVPAGPSAGKLLPAADDAAGFADHAVALTSIPGALSGDGFTLTSIDASARVSASTDYRGMAVVRPRLLRLGGELRVLGVTDAGIVATGFDAHGLAQTQSTRVLLPKAAAFWSAADADWFRAQAVGDRLWLLTLQGCDPYGDSTMLCNIVLQAFDAAGQAFGTPQILVQGVSPSLITFMRLEGGTDRLLATWRRGGLSPTWQFAVVDTATGLLLASGERADLAEAAFLQPAALNPGLALVYPSDATFGGLAAVALDAAFEPIRGTSGALNQELVSQPWIEPATLQSVAAGDGRLWFATSLITGSLESTLSELTWPAGAAASTGSLQLMARFPSLQWPFVLPLADRLLVIGGRNGDWALAATAVWRLP